MFPAPVAAASAMYLITAFVTVAPQKSPVADFHILLAPVEHSVAASAQTPVKH
jgi:hypothetical protein